MTLDQFILKLEDLKTMSPHKNLGAMSIKFRYNEAKFHADSFLIESEIKCHGPLAGSFQNTVTVKLV